MGQSGSTPDNAPAAGNGAGVDPTADPFSMKAWVCERPTHEACTTALKLATLPRPDPKANEVLVRVVSAGINPVDFKRLASTAAPFPAVAGVDGAGVIEAVGAGVGAAAEAAGAGVEGHVAPSLSVGDRVHFHLDLTKRFGTFAEYCVVDADTVIKIPSDVSFTDAAALPCAAWTAYTALFSKLRVETGRTILISGAAGGVGTFATQLAKRMGMFVIATCSTSNLAYVKDVLGADLVIDYTQDTVLDRTLIATKGAGVDYILDVVSADSGLALAHALRFGGALCQVSGGAVKCTDVFFTKQLSVHHVFLNGYHADPAGRAVLKQVGEIVMTMLQQKTISVPSNEVIKFEQIPTALEAMRERHGRGKIVAVIGSALAREDARKRKAEQPHASVAGGEAPAAVPPGA